MKKGTVAETFIFLVPAQADNLPTLLKHEKVSDAFQWHPDVSDDNLDDAIAISDGADSSSDQADSTDPESRATPVKQYENSHKLGLCSCRTHFRRCVR